eukprot:SAG22_NODE_2628_length_2360_cov_1.812030_5_plen_251_part_00
MLEFRSWWLEEGPSTLAHPPGEGSALKRLNAQTGHGTRHTMTIFFFVQEQLFQVHIDDTPEPFTVKISRPDGSNLEAWDLYVGARLDILGRPTTLMKASCQTYTWLDKQAGLMLKQIKRCVCAGLPARKLDQTRPDQTRPPDTTCTTRPRALHIHSPPAGSSSVLPLTGGAACLPPVLPLCSPPTLGHGRLEEDLAKFQPLSLTVTDHSSTLLPHRPQGGKVCLRRLVQEIENLVRASGALLYMCRSLQA